MLNPNCATLGVSERKTLGKLSDVPWQCLAMVNGVLLRLQGQFSPGQSKKDAFEIQPLEYALTFPGKRRFILCASEQVLFIF